MLVFKFSNMSDKLFLYYTRFYPTCNECGMRENVVSNYELGNYYCRVCACITLRKQNIKFCCKYEEKITIQLHKALSETGMRIRQP